MKQVLGNVLDIPLQSLVNTLPLHVNELADIYDWNALSFSQFKAITRFTQAQKEREIVDTAPSIL